MVTHQKANENGNTLFTITDIITQHLRYQQICIYIHTILAYLRDSLMYMRQVAIQTMYYINAATTNILSPNILPVEVLRNILRHIESQLAYQWTCLYHQMTPSISTGTLKHIYSQQTDKFYSSLMYLYRTEHNR